MLYFENQSGAKEDEYFRDGITEDIVTELSKITQLEIFPRSEMLAFRDKPVTAQQVGPAARRRVHAGRLDPPRRKSRAHHRATGGSVHAAFGVGGALRPAMEDVFAIQEEIARSIAQALRITLTPQEEKTMARKPTENPQAYDFYLRGRSYTRRENIDYALQMFEQAIQLDPNFALAHAGIAHLCGVIYEVREQNPKWIERGLAACDRATALAPDLPEVLVARARIFYAQKKYEEAAQLALRAIERKPRLRRRVERPRPGLFRRGPLPGSRGDCRARDGTQRRRLQHVHSVRAGRGAARPKEGSRRFARCDLKGVAATIGTRSGGRARAQSCWRPGSRTSANPRSAIRHLQTAVALRPSDSNTLYNAACTYGVLGRKSESLETLKKAFAAGFGNRFWAAKDSDLACLRDDPEFRKLVGLDDIASSS